jgi:hypothetical protein
MKHDSLPCPCACRRSAAAAWVLALLFAVVAGAGCARVPIASQRLVSKPNMVFGDTMVFNDQRRLIAQIEPGSAFSGGAQAAGCTACK